MGVWRELLASSIISDRDPGRLLFSVHNEISFATLKELQSRFLDMFHRTTADDELWASVYEAYSLHPIFDYIDASHGPTSITLEKFDEYLVDHEVLSESTVMKGSLSLGLTGTKARIILLLLWIIVDSLPSYMDVQSLISGALQVGLKKIDNVEGSNPGLNTLGKVVRVLADSLKLALPVRIRGKLKDLLRETNFDKAYKDCLDDYHKNIPVGMQLEYDVAQSPTMLLVKSEKFIFLPTNENTERLMGWCIDRLHIGHCTTSLLLKNSRALWNFYPVTLDAKATAQKIELLLKPLSRSIHEPPMVPISDPRTDISRAILAHRGKEEFIVLYALSIHPALDCIPDGLNIPWLSESYDLFSILKERRATVGQSVIRKASVMLSLLWFIGFFLPEAHIFVLISTAVEESLKHVRNGLPRATEILERASEEGTITKSRFPVVNLLKTCEDTIGKLVKTIVESPLKLFSQGRVEGRLKKESHVHYPEAITQYVTELNKKESGNVHSAKRNLAEQRAAISATVFPGEDVPLGPLNESYYLYDVAREPSALLTRHDAILSPQTKLSKFLIHHLIHDFHVGKSTQTDSANTSLALWTADDS